MTATQKPKARKPATQGEGAREVERRIAAFVAAYARTGNAGQAAKEAGYSPRSAPQQGGRLMNNAEIRERCAKAREEFLIENENTKKRQRKMLEIAADDAIAALQTVVQGRVSRGAVAMVSAATAILDRAGHKPVDESKIAHSSPDGSMTPRGPIQIVVEGG